MKDGRIYFAEARIGSCDVNPVKIGFTSGCPAKRLRAVALGCPFEIVLLSSIEGPRSLETWLHWQFHDVRLRGEWFRPAPQILELADHIKTRAGAAEIMAAYGGVHGLPEPFSRRHPDDPPLMSDCDQFVKRRMVCSGGIRKGGYFVSEEEWRRDIVNALAPSFGLKRQIGDQFYAK